MAPHLDMPTTGSGYTAGFNRNTYHTTTAGALDSGNSTPSGSESPMSSSFGGSTMEPDFDISRPLRSGVYVPTMCFFDAHTEDVDTETIASHAVRLARAGVAGLATQGSNGEAVHLTHSERSLVTRTTRKALNEAGFPHMPIIVGCNAQSTRETIEYCQQAWEAGGDYALVLPPSYYATLFAPSSQTILEYFRAVADASPIPIIIYNYPGAVGGMDLSSDVITTLAHHCNIVGVKLTCGNTGKLARVVANTKKLAKHYDPAQPEFLVLAGSADFTVQALSVGGHGILGGLANIAPKACIRTMALYHEDRHSEALALQETVGAGDWTAIQGGVLGVKSGMQSWMGYGGFARSPLPRPTTEQTKKWKEGFRELVMLEKSL